MSEYYWLCAHVISAVGCLVASVALSYVARAHGPVALAFAVYFACEFFANAFRAYDEWRSIREAPTAPRAIGKYQDGDDDSDGA